MQERLWLINNETKKIEDNLDKFGNDSETTNVVVSDAISDAKENIVEVVKELKDAYVQGEIATMSAIMVVGDALR